MSSIIVAHTLNNVIGKDNDMPWHLPADLKRFRELTEGSTVVMGRNTLESIIAKIGKPLPNRKNIVISKTLKCAPEGCLLITELSQLDKFANREEIAYIGGSMLFEEVLKRELADKLHITLIHTQLDGDTYFPKIDIKDWEETQRIPNHKDYDHKYDFDFIDYRKRQ